MADVPFARTYSVDSSCLEQMPPGFDEYLVSVIRRIEVSDTFSLPPNKRLDSNDTPRHRRIDSVTILILTWKRGWFINATRFRDHRDSTYYFDTLRARTLGCLLALSYVNEETENREWILYADKAGAYRDDIDDSSRPARLSDLTPRERGLATDRSIILTERPTRGDILDWIRLSGMILQSDSETIRWSQYGYFSMESYRRDSWPVVGFNEVTYESGGLCAEAWLRITGEPPPNVQGWKVY